MSQATYTGRPRSRRTPRSVRRKDRNARILITAGGVGTILAVVLIFAFLVSVVVPLFLGADLEEEPVLRSELEAGEILAAGTDEYRLTAWILFRDGRIRVLRADDGTPVGEDLHLIDGPPPTAWSITPEGKELILGFADGTIRTGRIAFRVDFLDPEGAPEELLRLRDGETGKHGDAVAQRTPEGQYRVVRLAAELDPPRKIADAPIRLIDFSEPPGGTAYAALSDDGVLAVYTISERLDMMTGETVEEVERMALPYRPPPGRGRPAFLGLTGIGNMLYLVWQDGFAMRYDARDELSARVAETRDLVEGDAQVTVARFMIAKTTLLVGDTEGRLRAWFPTRPAEGEAVSTVDGFVFSTAQTLAGPDSPVTSIAPSPRSRLAVAGYENGDVRVFQVTSGSLVADAAGLDGELAAAVAMSPKEDGLIALGPTRLRRWSLAAGHPEATLGTLFQKVWYEGRTEPDHVWQSTGGTDDFEPKLGLMKLVFGTLKATVYSMLIAIPIALLAAVFTSEFMKPKMRTPVKSVVEMMASLPSVVLGFLAALVIAPFVQDVVPAVLTCFLTVPVALLLGARLWQLLPTHRALEWAGAPRMFMVCVALPLGLAMAALLGPVVEDLFFAGDIKLWLDGAKGSATSGWMFLLLPIGIVGAIILFERVAGPWVRTISIHWSRKRCAVFDLGRFGVTLAAGISLAVLLGWALGEGFGFDPRGSIVGTYAQRNAMIVGFVMGFAIVPIIYTLAEDALSAVPSQLREGSLGAGATPWQTAMRIIVPTAMSGLFSAVMVGLGRAVGETMIVLMAAGNTPIMEWNVFNGFRTLSANIATELPEAVKDGTHYRTLFLAALVLFAMTFLINTLAEAVRRRFRARYQEQL